MYLVYYMESFMKRRWIPGWKQAANFLAGIENAISKDATYLKKRPITRRAMHAVTFVYSWSTWHHFWGAISGK